MARSSKSRNDCALELTCSCGCPECRTAGVNPDDHCRIHADECHADCLNLKGTKRR